MERHWRRLSSAYLHSRRCYEYGSEIVVRGRLRQQPEVEDDFNFALRIGGLEEPFSCERQAILVHSVVPRPEGLFYGGVFDFSRWKYRCVDTYGALSSGEIKAVIVRRRNGLSNPETGGWFRVGLRVRGSRHYKNKQPRRDRQSNERRYNTGPPSHFWNAPRKLVWSRLPSAHRSRYPAALRLRVLVVDLVGDLPAVVELQEREIVGEHVAGVPE